jgi:23S rRNA (cytidine1920-2'-O)/16S rRNA (cytidine1409-2'-O)-methyltransferase
VDVGYGQLHPRLRTDPRVGTLERTNFRTLAPETLHAAAGAPIELVVMDASFISATLLLPRIVLLAPGADVLVLVKPQFELAPGQVGKGGVVRDDALRAAAVARVREAGAALGFEAAGAAESRLAGPKGNREVFLWLRPRGEPIGDQTGTDLQVG